MFNSRHYIPIIRWKAAEKEALGELSTSTKENITPLIEFIMPQSNIFSTGQSLKELLDESIKKFQSLLPKYPNEILKYWGKKPVFADLSLIDESLMVYSVNQLLETGENIGITLIPVINLESSEVFVEQACYLNQKFRKGLCLRIFRSDIVDTITLARKIDNLINKYKLSKENIDLIVDFQIVDSVDQEYINLEKSIKKIPHLSSWRTFTCASGAFPSDLTKFSVDLHFIQRVDWNNWVNHFNSKQLSRMPAFADYTIQHPIFKEPVRGANPSASIRYTLCDQWMIWRGQGLRSPKSTGHAQYPAYAQLLSKHPSFFGSTFSYGDAYIEKIGKDIKTKNPGNPRTWIRAGINHHIMCTANQIANLS
ncbi:beta family protein [Candidatus Parcubacteria bacterium]|nr:beta family protein [Candidatus Parcubacteria bacterium]